MSLDEIRVVLKKTGFSKKNTINEIAEAISRCQYTKSLFYEVEANWAASVDKTFSSLSKNILLLLFKSDVDKIDLLLTSSIPDKSVHYAHLAIEYIKTNKSLCLEYLLNHLSESELNSFYDYRDEKGNSVVHLLCMEEKVFATCVRILLDKAGSERCLTLLRTPNLFNSFPMHIAFRAFSENQENIGVLTLLLSKCGDALEEILLQKSKYAGTVVECACNKKSFFQATMSYMLANKDNVNIERVFRNCLKALEDALLWNKNFYIEVASEYIPKAIFYDMVLKHIISYSTNIGRFSWSENQAFKLLNNGDTPLSLALLADVYSNNESMKPLLPKMVNADLSFLTSEWQVLVGKERKKYLNNADNKFVEAFCDAIFLSHIALEAPKTNDNNIEVYEVAIKSLANITLPELRRKVLYVTYHNLFCIDSLEREKYFRISAECKQKNKRDLLFPHVMLLLLEFKPIIPCLYQFTSSNALKDASMRNELLYAIDIIISEKLVFNLAREIFRYCDSSQNLIEQVGYLRCLFHLKSLWALKPHVESVEIKREHIMELLEAKKLELASLRNALCTAKQQDSFTARRKELNLTTKKLKKDFNENLISQTSFNHERVRIHQELKALIKSNEVLNIEKSIKKCTAEIAALECDLKMARTDFREVLVEQLKIKSNSLLDIETIQKLEAYFIHTRFPEAPFIYLASLFGLHEIELELALKNFKMIVDHLDDFSDLRYDLSLNSDLNEIHNIAPEVVKKWCGLTNCHVLKEKLALRQFNPTAIGRSQLNVRSVLERAILTDNHFTFSDNDINSFLLITNYFHLNWSREAFLDLLNQYEKNNPELKCLFDAQRLLVNLAEERLVGLQALEAIKNIKILLKLPKNHPFRGDLREIKHIFSNTKSKNVTSQLILTVSDDPLDILLVGTEPWQSCQRIDGYPDYNLGLLGYMLNGHTLPLGHKDAQTNKWITRALLRLVLIEQKDSHQPALLLERIYPPLISDQLRSELIGAAKMIADELGLVAISVGDGNMLSPVNQRVILGKGIASVEYVDSSGIGLIRSWPCHIQHSHYFN